MRFANRISVVLVGAVLVAAQVQVIALTPPEISNKAQQFTVRIDGKDDISSGSGVITKRQGNTYYVITAWHVVDEPGKYTVQAPDNKRYLIQHNQVRHLTGTDLAVLQFTTNQNYQVAEIGNSDQIKNGTTIYVTGFPLPGPAIEQRIYRFLSGSISGRLLPPKNGYELVYNVEALPGMSGGPVMNEQGQVVGIHGQGERDVRTGTVNSVLGITINTYLKLASNIVPSPTVTNPPRPVSPVVATQIPKPASEKPQSSADTYRNEQKGLLLAQEAASLGQSQQYDAALPKAQMASQLAPNNDKVWFLLGGLYLQTKQYSKALEALKKAEFINPRNADVQFAYGSIYFQQKEYQLAAQYYQAGLKLKPNYPEGLFGLGNVYYVQGKFQDANLLYELSISQNRTFWAAINNIGLIKYEQGDVEGAIKQWQSATNINNKAAEPALALAVALYTIGLKQQGLALGKQALLIDNRYRNLSFLQQNLWGKRLLADTKKFLEKI